MVSGVVKGLAKQGYSLRSALDEKMQRITRRLR